MFYPRLSKVVIVTPVESHRSGHIPQVVLKHLIAAMVHEVHLRVTPVKGVEAGDLLLLRILQDGVGAGARRGVVQDVRQQGLVHLNKKNSNIFVHADKTYLSFIKPTQYEEDVCAEALGDLSLVAEEAGQAVNQETVWQKLSNTQ